MTKRTFVLFFSLANILGLLLFPKQLVASHTKESQISCSSYAVECDEHDETYQEDCYDNLPIIQAHDIESEWKEALSDLLRHRQSSYRFVTFETFVSTYFQFVFNYRVFHKTYSVVSLFKGVITLPDYYSFLHRLCPF